MFFGRGSRDLFNWNGAATRSCMYLVCAYLSTYLRSGQSVPRSRADGVDKTIRPSQGPHGYHHTNAHTKTSSSHYNPPAPPNFYVAAARRILLYVITGRERHAAEMHVCVKTDFVALLPVSPFCRRDPPQFSVALWLHCACDVHMYIQLGKDLSSYDMT